MNLRFNKYFLSLCIYLILTTSAFAQNSNTGSVAGTVINPDGQAIPNATVAILPEDPESEELIAGTATNLDGEFEIDIDPGTYRLRVTFVSFNSYFTVIEITSGEILDVGQIELQERQEELDEVVVRGERSYVEMNFDSRRFNVGEDVVSLGGSALDVLDNVPSITTDFEGNVSLRGNQGVQILINGRPSNLVRGGTDGLGSIQASMIDEIEIITNPSARYEAQGTGGIINIKLVDNADLGFNGSIQSNAGHPQDYGAGINMNYNDGSINWFLNLDLEYESEPESGFSFQSFSDDTTYAYSETNDVTESEREGNVDFGADIYLPREQILTFSSRISLENGEEDGDLLYTDFQPNSPGVYQQAFDSWNIIRQANRNNLEEGRETDYDFNLQYEADLEGPDHMLTAEADFEFGSEDDETLLSENLEEGTSSFRNQRTFSEESFKEFRFDTDYERSIGNSGRFEAGLRLNFDWLDNNYQAQEFINGTWQTPLDGIGQAENFTFFENVNALYSIYSGEAGLFTYQVGLRLENTRIQTELDQTNEGSDQNYLNLFPSAFLSYTINQLNSLQLSYSRRISRPWSRFLLPFTEINDSRNRSVGNPNLEPEFGNSFELGYLRQWESGSLLTSVYYRYRTGVIERISTIDGNGLTTRRPINLATENSWGIEFSADQDLLENLSLSGSFNLFQSNSDGEYEGVDYTSEAESFTSRLRMRWGFLENWNFQSNVFYRGARQTTQGQESGDAYFGAGLSKRLLDGQATISLNARDIFNSRQSDREIINPNSYTNNQYSWSSRSFRLNFRYNFSSAGN